MYEGGRYYGFQANRADSLVILSELWPHLTATKKFYLEKKGFHISAPALVGELEEIREAERATNEMEAIVEAFGGKMPGAIPHTLTRTRRSVGAISPTNLTADFISSRPAR